MGSANRLLAVGLVAFLLSGCASLRLRDEDSVGLKIAKGTLRVPLAVLTLGMSEASYAVSRKMESWIGRPRAELLMAWGPPSQIYPDGVGGEIVVYAENRTYVSPGHATTTTTGSATAYSYGNTAQAYGSAQSNTTYTPPQVHQWTAYRMFRLGSDGRIISYSWKGL